MFLVTGGSGFIGSHFIDLLFKKNEKQIVNVDLLTSSSNFFHSKDSKRLKFYKSDICNYKKLEFIINKHKPKYVINFAAETHVDVSIESPSKFITTNIIGTSTLLKVIHKYNKEKNKSKKIKFIHISTDEVYGDLKEKKANYFRLGDSYTPSSPYSASKASSDLLIKAWNKTYDLNAIILNSSNNYGPRQNTEKLIPNVLMRSFFKKDILIYGNGNQIRDWVYVKDFAEAIYKATIKKKTKNQYLVGSGKGTSNLNLIKKIDSIIKSNHQFNTFNRISDHLKFVKDRPGHDFKYVIDNKKTIVDLNWNLQFSLEKGLFKTISYYQNFFYENKNKIKGSKFFKRKG